MFIDRIRFILKLLLIFLLFFQFDLAEAQTQPQLTPVQKEALNQEELEQTLRLTEKILSKMAEGSFYDFAAGEAIPQLEQMFTEDFQKEAYKQISGQVGEYTSPLTFTEAFQVTFGGFEGMVYRFRGKFSNSETDPEVRVTMTLDDQLAGIQVLPWNDLMLQQ